MTQNRYYVPRMNNGCKLRTPLWKQQSNCISKMNYELVLRWELSSECFVQAEFRKYFHEKWSLAPAAFSLLNTLNGRWEREREKAFIIHFSNVDNNSQKWPPTTPARLVYTSLTNRDQVRSECLFTLCF